MKQKLKHIILSKKFHILFIASLLVIVFIAINNGGNFGNNKNTHFISYSGYYNSDQYVIGSISKSDDTNIISLTEAVNDPSKIGNKTITISTDDELYLFSNTLKENESFRSLNYKLMSNIDYEINSSFTPIQSFSGTFDGMGYEIKNLLISSAVKIGNVFHVAMFGQNNGTITNFGLVEPNIRIDGKNVGDDEGQYHVAPICGINNGEISYVFVRDMRNPQTDIAAGMVVNGNHVIAGLVYENNADLHDSYVAYEIIVNRETVDIISYFNEVLAINNGNIKNLSFYHGSIEKYERISDTQIEIKYDSGTINQEHTLTAHYGTYCSSIESLITTVTENDSQNGWYSAHDYGRLATYLSGIPTPISRGMRYDDETQTFTITNVEDYCYMYELMNLDPHFASSNITYKIIDNINLGLVIKENYHYDRVIDATITGVELEESKRISKESETGKVSPYPTIYNATVDKVLIEGVESYGLFSYVSGTISNLNIVDVNFNKDNTNSSNNIQAIGLAVGYLNGGTINNINTFDDLTFNSNIGKFFVGHVVGFAGGNAVISNVTANGKIINQQGDNTSGDIGGFIQGSAIGGILGYSESTLTSLNTCLSTVEITANTFNQNTNDIAVGGILGAGYTNQVKNLENRGSINVEGGSRVLYVSGIIARHLGMKEQASYLNNAGDVNVTLNGQTKSYVSGVSNVDIQIASTQYLSQSQLKNNGRYQYYGSAFTNGASITVTKTNGENCEYTNVLNMNSSNGFESVISGVYNLGYRSNSTKTSLGVQTINMNEINEFAPVVNINNNTTNNVSQTIDAETIYNLRDINFTTTANINANLKYTGCILGEYINYTDVRNEGDLTFDIKNATNQNRTLYVSGVFDKISNGYKAENIYNGGNISIVETATGNVNLNIYASGICYSNESVITDTSYNPLSEDFDKESKGTLNNVINNGDILITSSDLNDNTGVDKTQTCGLQGNMYVSGILHINEGIVSNTFNLGDLKAALYLSSQLGIYVGGLVNINEGQNAQIRDSANNGTIRAINLCGTANSYVYAGGIVCRNDTNTTNSSQNIAFTINYGEIYAFNAKKNAENANNTIYTKAGGILSTGICNIVNTVNYGSVFSTETAGGMIGSINLSSFNNDEVIIANTLNYGTVKAINRYLTVNGAAVYALYSDIKDIESNSKYISYGIVAQPFYQYCGALIGIINYENKDIINIRYLINFFENVQIASQEINTPQNVSTNVSLLVNVTPNYKFIGQNVTYAPLSTVSDEHGNIGVFSEEFMFRKAINGENLDPNEVTDSYIGDFFQFVSFEKINTVLLDLIGWREIAYLDAAERFAKDLEALSNLITKAGISETNAFISEALSSNTWLESCDTLIIDELLESALNSNELNSEELDSLIRYILFESSNKSLFTKEARKTLISKLIKYIEEKENQVDYLKVLNTLLYDELLAKVIANDTLEYAEAYKLIRNIIENSNNLEEIVSNYIELLNSDSNLLEPLFSNEYSDYYLEAKVNLLNTLLTGISDEQLKTIFDSLDKNNEENSSLKYLMFLEENPDIARNIYISVIANNSFNNSTYMQSMNNAFAKYNIADIVDNEFNDQMIDNFDASMDEYAKDNYVDLWNIVKNDKDLQAYISNLSNGILQNVVSVDGKTGIGLYAKATEYTNTYQSNDAPSTPNNQRGITRTTSANGAITTRFIYTPDNVVSEATYFYGPYNSNNQIWWTNNKPGTYNQGFNLYTTGEDASNITIRYVPFFCSVDKEFAQNMINGSANSTLYEFYWNNPTPKPDAGAADYEAQGGQSQSQWVSTHIIDKQPTDGHHYLLYNYTNGQYVDHGYDFSPGAKTSINEYNETNITIPRGTDISYYDSDGNYVQRTSENNQALNLITRIAFADRTHYYRNYYLKGYISASLFTGIWYQQNIWTGNNQLYGAFLTSKTENNQDGYVGVHTTQYINYFVDDLLKLDGKLTKGFGNNAVSNDEINIINDLMDDILRTDAGKEVVIKALAEQSLNGFASNNSEEGNLLLDTVKDSSFAPSAIESTTNLTEQQLNNISYDENTTLKEHLDSLINDYDYNYKEEIIINSVNNLENFRKIILSMYEFSKETINYEEYNLEKTKINDYVYEYAKHLLSQNPDISDAEITALLEMISDIDLENIDDLFTFEKIIQDQTFDNITLNGTWTYADLINDVYSKSITATNNASINIVLPNDAEQFEITFTGTIQIDGTTYTRNTIDTVVIQKTGNITNYTINVDNGTTIYDIKSIKYNAVLLDETNMITISDSDQSGNITVNNYQYNILGRSQGTTAGKLVILDANEIPEDVSVTFYYDYIRYGNNQNGNLRLYLGDQRVANHTATNSTNTGEYQVVDNTGQLYLTTSSTRNDRGYTVSNMRLVYKKTIDGITYTYTQYLNGDPNTINVTSTTAQHIGIQTITGNNQGNITRYDNITSQTVTGNQDSYFRIYTYDEENTNHFDGINGTVSQTSVQNNFNNYYDDLEGYSKYLVDNAVKSLTGTTSVTVDKESYVLIKARRTSGNSSSIRFNNTTQNTTNTSMYYCFRVGAGTYNVTTTNSTVDEILIFDVDDRLNVTTSGNTNTIVFEDNGIDRVLFEEDYSDMALFDIDSIIPTPLNGLTKFETFVKIYPYVRNTSDSSASELWEKDLVELVMTLFPTMKDNENKYYEIFNNTNLFTEDSLKELVELLSVADYEDDESALYKLIQYLGNEYYDETIITVTDISNELSVDVLEELKEVAINEKYSKIKNYYIAAYLGDDLLKNQANNSLLNSKIYEILNEYQNGRYQFITSDTSIDSDKFIELMNHLGFDLNTQGYGIYALSSSKGILNGEFIPDNIVLDKLDTHYESNGDLYILSDEESSNWRGGLDDNEDNTSNKESVNYAILVEMKQLKKSIGTTIFKFDLIDENEIIHYSSESSIDLDEGVITYYVPTGYFDNVSNELNVIFDTISISNSAKLYLNGTLVSKENTQIILNGLTANNIIRVIAEDTTVYKDYSINFVEMEVNYEIQYSSVSANATLNNNVATVPYKDGQVVISLTSTTLPENLDLTPYIDIYKASNGEKIDRQTAFKLSNADGDHIINSNSDAIITMDILSTLPYGEYLIEVNIFGIVRTLSLVKNPSTECDVLEFEYDGVDITSILMQDGEYTSYIDFGRAYNYGDLTDITSTSFYLTRLLFSENATCQIEVEKEEIEGLLTYTVTYEVIAENGNSKTFTHILKEKHPFKNYNGNVELTDSFNFASHYKDGSITETLTYDFDNSNDINVAFERGSEPEYRVKYTLSNFYLLGEDVEFIIDDSNALGVSYTDSYAGITAVVTNACDAGVYTLVYSYKNIGVWDDGEYERVWEFPAFIITKNYSKDATLNNITYIDGNSMLSSFSTVISVENSFRPSDASLKENEIDYHMYADLEDSEKDIFAAGTYINYVKDNGPDYSISSYKDYYMIGVLSNANLSYYAPIFKIEDHAEIYQYTTREKLDYYGILNQGDKSDRSILSNHDTCYIYVPYDNGEGIVTVFLVEVDDQNQWGNVYTTDSNATGDPITTLDSNKGSFEYEGVTYSVHKSAGKPTNNSSLYMDYIGTPLEDHFWYVSYVVFSENALNTTNNEFVKYFHLSLIDLTNNVYFDIIVNTPLDLPLDSIYITFAGLGIEVDENTIISKQLSANVTRDSENGEYATYILDNDIQILPTGYYYFYLDLPDGYKVTYEITNGKTNKNEADSGYDGAYLPPSSIVPQRISITFTVLEDENISGLWGVSTSEIYSRMAEEIINNE